MQVIHISTCSIPPFWSRPLSQWSQSASSSFAKVNSTRGRIICHSFLLLPCSFPETRSNRTDLAPSVTHILCGHQSFSSPWWWEQGRPGISVHTASGSSVGQWAHLLNGWSPVNQWAHLQILLITPERMVWFGTVKFVWNRLDEGDRMTTSN